MKDTQFVKEGQVEIVEVPRPEIKNDEDVIIRVIRACVWIRLVGI